MWICWLGSEDGTLSCGYSSFRGERASMEDFFDVRNSTIDGQTVNLFGIFDGQVLIPSLLFFQYSVEFIIFSSLFQFSASGHGGSRAAEYLTEHLFENLLKHPEFLTDMKKAICMVFFEL